MSNSPMIERTCYSKELNIVLTPTRQGLTDLSLSLVHHFMTSCYTWADFGGVEKESMKTFPILKTSRMVIHQTHFPTMTSKLDQTEMRFLNGLVWKIPKRTFFKTLETE